MELRARDGSVSIVYEHIGWEGICCFVGAFCGRLNDSTDFML